MNVSRRVGVAVTTFVVAAAAVVSSVPQAGALDASGSTMGGVCESAEAVVGAPQRADEVRVEAPEVFEAAAELNEASVSTFVARAEDEAFWLDRCGEAMYVEDELSEGPVGDHGDSHPAAVGEPEVGEALPNATVALADTFLLESKPGADRTIFLDFDGATVTNTAWNSSYTGQETIVAPPYSYDSTVSTSFSSADLTEIQRTWQVVAEDFAPFDVNVTTKDPGVAAIDRMGSTDLKYGSHVLVTGSGPVYDKCQCGGVAYLNVFNASSSHMRYQPAWVFGKPGHTGKTMGEAASHEVGHNFGLHHDGTSSQAYYGGSSPWAPVMGVGYSQPVSQWSRGEYADANQQQDDLSVIATGAPVRADDHGNSAATATTVQAGVAVNGVIATAGDVDVFRFTGSRATSLTVSGAAAYSDLDVELTIRDAAGEVVAVANPAVSRLTSAQATGLGASWSGTLPDGGATYTATVDGVGSGDPTTAGKYSDYGSLGNYQVVLATSEVSESDPLTTTVSAPPSATATVTYSFQPVAASGGSTPYEFNATGLPDGIAIVASTGELTGAPTTAGTYPVTIGVTDAVGATRSENVTLVVRGAQPKITTSVFPRGMDNRAYSARVSVVDGVGPYTFTAVGIPAGLRLGASTGVLSGTPTAPGGYTLRVSVEDSNGASSYRFINMTVARALAVKNGAVLPHAKKHRRYDLRIAATGGTLNYGWARTSGSLPKGLRFERRGNSLVLAGRPVSKGIFKFSLVVRDATGVKARKNFRITVRR